MGTNALLAHGAMPPKGSRYAPISNYRYWTGLWSQGNPLGDPATQYLVQKFYSGARYERLIAGLNLEISNRLTLRRRPGHSIYNSQNFPAIQRFYEFRQVTNNTETISVIADTSTAVFDATGPNTKTQLFAKSSGAGQSYFQSVGNVLYVADSVDSYKYYIQGGVSFLQNWGLSIGNTVGPTTAGTGANFNQGGGAIAWTTPGHVTDNLGFATVAVTPAQASQRLQATNFGFSVPAGTPIVGIQVTLIGNFSSATGRAEIGLLKNGSPQFSRTLALGTGIASITIGGAGDLWHGFYGSSDVNNTNFGVYIIALGSPGGSFTTQIQQVQITLITGFNLTVSNAGAGALTGWYGYVACYCNSKTNTLSSPSNVATVNLTGAEAQLTLIASPDTQCDQIRVFRTDSQASQGAAQGGPFFEIPGSPFVNANATPIDNATDVTLNLFSQAPNFFQNNPPPAGFIPMAYHLGCIWGAVGNTVYFSAGPTVINGNGNEAFPPVNNYVMPSLVVSMVATTLGLMVFTTSGAYFIGGSNTASDPLQQPAPILVGKLSGLLNFNNLDVTGSTIYLRSSNGKLLMVDLSSGVSEVGFPIGDQLLNITNGVGNVSWCERNSTDSGLYVTDGAANWFRLNPTPAPESGMTWSPLATIGPGFSAVQSIETSPGTHDLLLGPATNGPILKRDQSTFADNGTLYAAHGTLGSLVLAHPGQLAELAFVTTDCMAVGSHPTVSVLLGEISGVFEPLSGKVPDPPDLPAASSLYNDRWYFSTLQQAIVCRHLQMDFAWPAENAANELLSYTIFGAHYQEL